MSPSPTEPRIRELKEGETALAYLAMIELRPHVGTIEKFVATVDEEQRPAGYRLVGSFDPELAGDQAQAAAVAGFRTGHSLSWGHFVYVDDLVARSGFRGRGHAGGLVQWLKVEGARLGCQQLHLDSGTQRHDAHRLYLGQGLRITSFHFVFDVEPPKAAG